MNCQRFEDFVVDIAREQMIEVATRQKALEHTQKCNRCARRLKDETHLTLRLRSFTSSVVGSVVPTRVEAHLMAAFDEQAILRTARLAMIGRRSWVAAAAAVLLIVAGVLGIRWRLPASVPPVPDSLANEETRASGEKTEDSSPVITKRSPSNVIATFRPRRSSLHRNRGRAESNAKPASANDRPREIATDFIPVSYGGVNLDEGGRVVRVELPRSAMAKFGLPVNMNRANERVKADVLFGIDGLAHAIRFVQ
ncbi:MAG TPA: hypothetical protein VFU37_13900 [Pyrinomonadaceae bacterium]|nr:hypothetical protein [Pyrinomonadaceae bacterium]